MFRSVTSVWVSLIISKYYPQLQRKNNHDHDKKLSLKMALNQIIKSVKITSVKLTEGTHSIQAAVERQQFLGQVDKMYCRPTL